MKPQKRLSTRRRKPIPTPPINYTLALLNSVNHINIEIQNIQNNIYEADKKMDRNG